MKLLNDVIHAIGSRLSGNSIFSIKQLLLKSVVLIFCIFGFPSVLVSAWEVFLQGKPEISLIYIGIYLPFICCLVFQKRLSYQWQTGIVLLALYVLAVVTLGRAGLSGAGLNLLITFIVLTTTFSGMKGGLLSVFASIATILTVGAGMSYGWLPVDYVAMTNSTRIEAWTMAATLFLIIGGIMVACPGILQQRLVKNVEIITEKTSALEASNQKLKKALKDRQEMEEKLVSAKRMEAMGLLAAGVAHDLNNILTGVTTYPDLLLYSISPQDPLYEPLKIIKSSGDKAAAIVEDLTTLSKSNVNVKKVVGLAEIIQHYMDSPECAKLRRFHPDVEIHTDLSNEPGTLFGSEIHIFNVIMNLVSNAAESIPFEGRIDIRAYNLVIDQDLHGIETVSRGEYAVLEVSDTGIGITDQDLNSIFEPFFTQKKMGRSGTGLGMTIVQSVVKDHNGFIDIKSSQTQGSRFTLYFPVTRESVSARKEGPARSRFMGQGEKVLLVDDVKEQRQVGSQVLGNLGYVPVCVESGEKAIAYCEENKPDLLITDMVMDPGINGYDTLKAIRQIYPNLKSIIITGFSETDLVRQAMALGKTVLLKKPYTIEKFSAAVHEQLHG